VDSSDDVLLKNYHVSEWRTFRANDHPPLWLEFQIGFADEYLTGLSG